MAERVIAAYQDAGLTIGVAESLTGGALGATLSSVAGASAVFRGGIIVYATDLKASLGGVPVTELASDGPVSARTAESLARGAAMRTGADVAIALTGVAGPDTQDGHEVGTVYLGWVAGDTVQSTLAHFTGDRRAIRAQTVESALTILLNAVVAEA